MFFLKIKLTHRTLNLYHPFVTTESIAWIFFSFFGLVRFALGQLVSSSPFALLYAVSPLSDIATLPRCVMLPSHGAKMSSLAPLFLSAKLRPVASSFKSKPKHWIHTTTLATLPGQPDSHPSLYRQDPLKII
jgi:hypothetical protein